MYASKIKTLSSALPKPAPHSRNFIGAWIRDPFAVGAVMPSSRALARAMAAQVDINVPGTVIELGAGTGAITQALIETGIGAGRLAVVERDAKLCLLLSHRFPQMNVVCADAMRLMDDVVSKLADANVNAIVSGLPLLSMPRIIRYAIEEQMAQAIGDQGCIVQFTYGPKSPISAQTRRRHRLTGKRVKTVLANVPPARVWVYRKERLG